MKLSVATAVVVTVLIITLVVLRVLSGWYLGPEREPPAHPGSSSTVPR